MNWAKQLNEPAVVAALVSAAAGLISIGLSIWQARRQAKRVFDAEAMKLRHEVGDRYSRVFHDTAERLTAILMEAPYHACIAQRYEDGWPQTPANVGLYAELAMLHEDWTCLKVVELQFSRACQGLHAALSSPDRDSSSGTEGGPSPIIGCCQIAVRSLFYLMRAVDISSEGRIGLRKPGTYQRELDDLVHRWRAEMKDLKNMLPDSAPIRQASVT